MLGGAGLFAERLDPLHDEIRLWQDAEEVREPRLDEGEVLARGLEVRFAPFVRILKEELRILTHEREEFLERALEADGLLDRLHLGADARDFLQAEVVDLVGRHPGRRAGGEALVVELASLR